MNKRKSVKRPMMSIDTHPGGPSLDINDMKTTSARDKVSKENKNCSQTMKSFGPLRFHSKELQKMYQTEEGSCKYSEAVVENFFEKMEILQTVSNQLDLRNHKNLGFHKLKKGKLKGKYAVSLTGHWRLIIEIVETEEAQKSKYLLINDIVQYH